MLQMSVVSCTYLQIYTAPKIVRAYLRQGGNTVKVDGKRWNFRRRLKVDTVSIEQMCAGTEFQVEGADAEKAQEENLLVIPGGLVKRLVLEERKDLDGR